MKGTIFSAAAIAGAAALAWPSTAPRAQDAADFYKGRTLTVYVGVSPGGIYSTFATMLARHMGRHMAGNPTVIVQHMPGAGGTKAVSYVYSVAPRDGTAAITPNSGVDKRVVLEVGQPRYDPARMHWLGGWGEAVNTISVRWDAPAKTLEEAMEKEVILGAIGKATSTYMIPSLTNTILGTKFQIITGYGGGGPIRLAIENGEVHGWSGQWLGWKLAKPDWVREGKLVHLVQMASRRAPDLPDVPLLTDFARNEEERQMFRFAQIGLSDRAFVVPPDVPEYRMAALTEGYMATLRDPAFLNEAEKHQYTIDPIPGEEIQEFVEEIMRMPPAMVDKLRRAMGVI